MNNLDEISLNDGEAFKTDALDSNRIVTDLALCSLELAARFNFVVLEEYGGTDFSQILLTN